MSVNIEIPGLTGDGAYALARNYTNKKFKETIAENFGEAKIDEDGNLIITTVDSTISFKLNENGELLLIANSNDISDISETELNDAIDNAIDEIIGGEV